jgi:two-component system, sensor histidine kinase and response regulator
METKKKILIVDDAVDTVELLKKRLSFEGYDTGVAYDGEEAVRQVDEYKPDLIILDIMLPKIDGYEVCRRLKSRKRTKYIPILMLTAKGGVEDKVMGLDIGADDYFAKPFNYTELSARIRSLLSMKAARDALVAEEKAGALDQMIGGVEHEIRNPLTSIGGLARRVHDSLAKGSPTRKYTEMIIKDVARLEKMIKDLIELKTAAMSYKEPTNLNDLILSGLGKYKQEIDDKDIEVRTRLVVPAPFVSADEEQLKLAFAHLIENAIEAMDAPPRVIEISGRISDGLVETRISDTGRGIPKDKIKSIFDPFFTSKTRGPGLGLTLTLKIVQAHRGTLSVESEPGKGAAFTVRLPTAGPRYADNGA